MPFDRALIERYLPIPLPMRIMPTAEAFADIVMERGRKLGKDDDPKETKGWRNVGLMPLSQEQRRLFAVGQGISDPDALLEDIRTRDAEDFAGRPQDLIELCADWRDHHRIRSHRDQVESNIAVKLKPRTDRRERIELSQEAAIEGASRLALAAILTRKLTLRHSAEADRVPATEPALDVSKVLLDWDAAAQATLLERPLFGFASYGRVRFHHRSVVEFLAAKRLDTLLGRGAPIKAVKRLLFAETAQGVRVVRPSMRPVAAWLGSWHAAIFDDLVLLDPGVILNEGDPQSLSVTQRTRALEAYVERHGAGSWRGLQTPSIQIHRFVAKELAGPVVRLWGLGIENGEVRDLLLRLIAAGRLSECADVAYTTAMDNTSPHHERSRAIEALIRLSDARLGALSASIESDEALWPPGVARSAVVDLFPVNMPVDRLKNIMGRAPDDRSGLGDYTYHLRQKIAHAELTPSYLDGLREAFADLVTDGLAWAENAYPHVRTRREDLLPALIAACCRQSSEGVQTEAWLRSSLLAVRLSKREHGDEKPLEQLRKAIGDLPAETREAGFWQEAALLESLRPMKDAWGRVFELTHESGITLDDTKDAVWVRRRLSDPAEPLEHRAMMLWAEMLLLHRDADHRFLLESLKRLVKDAPTLVAVIDERLEPHEESPEHRRWRMESAEHKRQQEEQEAEAHASWIAFWQEIVRDPDAVFHPNRANNTAWNLWRAVERSGKESRAAGWNRELIEQQFGKPVADRLRETMMAAWRKDRPTLASERPESEKNSFLIRWQFGLAAITAEAEDPNWAKRLTEEEAELACRYAPVQLNGFPPWLESLAVEHPVAIDRVLGPELSSALRNISTSDGYATALQDVAYAPAIVATLFTSRVRTWLAEFRAEGRAIENPHTAHHLGQAINILAKNGTDDDRRFVETEAVWRLAAGDPFAGVWLPALLNLNPAVGVETLERRLREAQTAPSESYVEFFGNLFDSDRGASIDLGGAGFTPLLLLRLLRLAYRHNVGSHSPNPHDDFERTRNSILSALFAAAGPDGWNAKLEMAVDPLFAHLKDRTLAVATEKAAEEADSTALTESEFVVLDKEGEAAPANRDAMFALMRDRLDDLDDLLLQDISPREAWAGITEERVMRRELARTLREAAKTAYTVDQEAVTADEKETDIRLRSTVSTQQGTIELKLADDRSGRDLFDTLREQLLKKYMAADACRAGCLLVTIAREREWENPLTGTRIGFDELMRVLNEEAEAISRELGGTAKLLAKGLDLRPRLNRE